MNTTPAKIAAWPLLAITLGSLAFVACGSDEESNDAPRDDAPVANATVIAMPDEYSNVAAKCFGTDMIYTARNVGTPPGRAVAVSPNHPWCEDGVLTKDEQKG
jgi:hypothetical protein